VVTEPAPVVTEPAPVVTEPAPVVTEPAPVVTEPAPVVTEVTAPTTDASASRSELGTADTGFGGATGDDSATASLTGSRASKSATETARQVAVGEEDDEKEEEEEGQNDVIAPQVVFAGGRGIAQEADIGRHRPSEGAARDVFGDGSGP